MQGELQPLSHLRYIRITVYYVKILRVKTKGKIIIKFKVFCWSQKVINGTDKVCSQGTVKIAALRFFFFFVKGPLLDVLYLSLSQTFH